MRIEALAVKILQNVLKSMIRKTSPDLIIDQVKWLYWYRQKYLAKALSQLVKETYLEI